MGRTNFVFSVMVGAAVLGGCDGGGGGASFSTSVPGDRPLNGLSSSEVATICADVARYISSDAYKNDTCRLDGFLTAALQAGFSSTVTDAELQAACTQTATSCLATANNPTCGAPPATCTATVAELTTCANDNAAQTHMLASQVPDCAGINRASISAHSSVLGTALAGSPASCQAYQAKCGGVSTGGSDGGGSSSGEGGSSGPRDGGID